MSDILRKPAYGTPARQAYDDAKRLRQQRRICTCGSGHYVRLGMEQCIACHPETKDRFAEMQQTNREYKMSRGSTR